MSQLGIYLDGYSFDIRSRNSDWSLVEKRIPRVADWAPEMRFVHQKSRSVMLKANCKAIHAALARRINLPLDPWTLNTSHLDARELARSGCDLVFSHREFPLNAGDVPVVWMSALVDPEMEKSYFGLDQATIDRDFAVKSKLFRRAAIVQVCTHAEAARHAQLFPDIAGRFVTVPLFGPDLRAAPEDALEKHRDPTHLQLLFVGNQARRKGLHETLKAYMLLPEAVRRSTTFTIISHFDRGTIDIPSDPGIVVRRGLPQSEVLNLMRASHVLVNVAHHESYGMVFLEAMSQGMLCVGPDWEVQRELFDGGRAGMNVRPEVDAIRAALLRAIEDHEYRFALAAAGWQRFNHHYAPEVVARKYADLFRSVALGDANRDPLAKTAAAQFDLHTP